MKSELPNSLPVILMSLLIRMYCDCQASGAVLAKLSIQKEPLHQGIRQGPVGTPRKTK